ncbi:hypothetical protein CKO25_09305 [Thiocapsa imhoffii]|uniref:Aminotransferase class III-fold pyridoxal phosphate-dependent enzyme n=1 Tax=Thiocapsa imhoffii TaxID=382777 RepID=A0A9X1B9A6_9GAMM|nr:type I polyketide synthase [Thiocapsa imhoffii]MBK1644841.1 hypothetical protein [Thiocapsa imhoffii]
MSEYDPNAVPADAIAIIGLSGRFPGAGDARAFWRNLLQGRESITFFEQDELDPAVAEEAGDPLYIRAKGILEGIECFDATLFGIPPAEARMLDPQQRVLLELAWAALEDAGYGSPTRTDKIAVYAGTNWNRYETLNLATQPELLRRYGAFNAALANEADFPATRISYKLNLTGPSVSLFTACSTSLVAVSEAVKSLLNYECEMALAGGASITLPQRQGYLYQDGGMLSRDGHTRTFDAASSGTTFNEGAALLLLKRLEDALADRDHIYAVIRGAAINNDGGEKMSFTAPSVAGQADVIASALAAADLAPESITYIETHGTATPLGDPIEVAALHQVYAPSAQAGAGSCVLGALKSNVGHLTHAAGVAGLIKLAFCVEQGRIPATLHFHEPNPALHLEQTRFRVNQCTEAWEPGQWPRRGAVSSFGVGGTNAHVIIEQAPRQEPSDPHTAVPVALVSARHAEGPTQLAQALADRLAEEPDLNLGDVTYSLAVGRQVLAHRLAVVARDLGDMTETLRRGRGPRLVRGQATAGIDRLVFAFPGQGAQRLGMGADLYHQNAAFRDAMDACLQIADARLDLDLRTLTVAPSSDESIQHALEQTRYTQPALFAMGYALGQALMAFGVRPDVMVGHSVGEFVAATLAGVMSLEDGMHLIIERARLMQAMPAGGMLAVHLDEDAASRLAEAHQLTIAAVNAPDLTVLSGRLEQIAAAEQALADRGLRGTRLRTSHAFHSAMMDPAAESFADALADIVLRAPQIPIVSTATGAVLTDAEATSHHYWQRHLRVPVRFAEAMRTLCAMGRCAMIELGPGATLTALAKRQSEDEHLFVAALAARDLTEQESLMSALAQLWVDGVDIPWSQMFGDERRARVSLPTYPFERQRHWVDPVPMAPVAPAVPIAPDERMPQAAAGTSADVIHPAAVESCEMTSPQEKHATDPHYAQILARVVALFEDVSGLSLQDIDPRQSFVTLGFDSLFMTQASAALKREFSVPLSFRQLSAELDSPEALARFLAERVAPSVSPASATPADAPQPQGATNPTAAREGTPGGGVAPAANALAAATSESLRSSSIQTDSALGAVIAEQLRLMGRQLEMLSGSLTVSAPPLPQSTQTTEPAAFVAPRQPDPDASQPRIAAPQIDPASQTPGKLPLRSDDDRPVSVGSWDDLDARRRTALQTFMAEHVARTGASKAHIARFRGHHADPRTAAGFSRVWKEIVYPIVCERSSGARLWDLDGNEYIDLLNGFGPNFLGHAHPEVVDAIRRELSLGFEIGPQQRLAGEAAELVCELTGMDRASFMCTGSEAVQAAIRCARTYTQRDKIVLFRGDYHGNFDEVLVRGVTSAGHLKTLPSAPGIPPGSVGNVIVLEYGHDSALKIIEDIADQVAAVMVEPVQSRRPELQPRDFLHRLRAITEQHGALLIFDEVVTGFRCHPGGAQAHFGVRADLATYGKVAGGNMPLGIVAGRRAVMDTFDGGTWAYGDDSKPDAGVTFFAGTFVRQPFAIAGCHATLSILKREGPQLQRRVNTMTEGFASRINALFANHELPFEIPHFSSVMYLRNRDKSDLGSLLWYYLRHYGVFALEGFPTYLTASHTPDEIDQLVERFRLSVERMIADGMLHARSARSQSGANAGSPTMSLAPPVPGARLGKDPRGNPAWYAPDPDRPGAYVQIS